MALPGRGTFISSTTTMSHIPRGRTKNRLQQPASWLCGGRDTGPHWRYTLYRTGLVHVPWLVHIKGNACNNSHRRDARSASSGPMGSSDLSGRVLSWSCLGCWAKAEPDPPLRLSPGAYYIFLLVFDWVKGGGGGLESTSSISFTMNRVWAPQLRNHANGSLCQDVRKSPWWRAKGEDG